MAFREFENCIAVSRRNFIRSTRLIFHVSCQMSSSCISQAQTPNYHEYVITQIELLYQLSFSRNHFSRLCTFNRLLITTLEYVSDQLIVSIYSTNVQAALVLCRKHVTRMLGVTRGLDVLSVGSQTHGCVRVYSEKCGCGPELAAFVRTAPFLLLDIHDQIIIKIVFRPVQLCNGSLDHYRK